jgi:hypothetical protein
MRPITSILTATKAKKNLWLFDWNKRALNWFILIHQTKILIWNNKCHKVTILWFFVNINFQLQNNTCICKTYFSFLMLFGNWLQNKSHTCFFSTLLCITNTDI